MSITNDCNNGCNKHSTSIMAYHKIFFLSLAFFLFSSGVIFAQTGTVSGTVKDADNKPVDGATIIVKQTKVSTVADKDGNFSIQAVKGNTITVTSVNFQPQDFVVGSLAVVDVKLERVTGSLNDVVVIGYGTARKKDVTGAVTSVNINKLAEVPLTSVDQALTGRAGGVQISQSNGQAGAGTSIRIRGGNSLNGTNEPLFVIDGFPIINDNAAYAAGGPLGLTNSLSGNGSQGNPNGALNWLNPADIASIEVLKDASATAIYGSRGANGVIIITTKKGKTGQTKLNFNASYGVSQLNDGKIKLMNGKEYAAYANLFNKEQGFTVFYKDTTIGGVLFPSPDKVTTNTNWIDAISRKGATQNYSLDFSGGKDVLYSGSIGWVNQETPLVGSQFKRANFRLNLSTNLTPWLSLDNTASYSESKADNSPADIRDVQKFGMFEAALATNPAEPVYKADGTLNYLGGVPPINGDARIVYNPLALGTDVLNRNTVQTFLNNISLKAKIISGLTFEVRGSLFKNDLLRDIYYNSLTTFNGYQVSGLGGKNSNNSNSYLVETFANYNKTFEKNQLSAVGGYSYQTSTYRTISSGSSGFSNDILKNENLASGSTQYPTQSTRIEDLLSSYYVRLNNVYNDKYIVTFTARYDGSSKFQKPNQWSFFPSGALSWRISQEDFLKSSKSISDLKLRLSYGLSGNQAVRSLQTKSTLGFNQYPYGGILQTGVFPEVLGNPGLKWETTKQLNVGLDFGFWNQRLSGSINYYVKNTDGLLQFLPIPANSGYSSQLNNVGSISNKGIELELRGTVLDKKDFKWDINANIASNKQKVTDLGRGGLDTLLVPFQVVGGSTTNVALIKGQPVGLFFGYVSDGIFRTAAELTSGPAISGSKVGTRRFKDLNNDGQINDKDRRVIGDPNPKFTFGITNNFSYKAFDLNFLLQGSVGGDMWNLGDYVQTRLGNRSQAANDYFTPTNTNAKYPAPGQNVGYDNHSDFTVESASYLRLKSLNIGYNLPAGTVKFVRSIRVYASGTNLFTSTKYSGYDPEVNSFAQSNLFRNIDILSIPLYKTYTIGINVGF
jgi:TonB-dependent starch-binding outer membrane protein SusC